MKEEIQILVDMFVENKYKKTFLETLVKDYNAKKKTNDSCNCTNSKKSHPAPLNSQKSTMDNSTGFTREQSS